MVHHIIVKFVDEVDEQLKSKIAAEVLELFNNLIQMDGIYKIQVKHYKIQVKQNCIDRSNRFNLMIQIEMDRDSLTAYDESIWHKKWKEDYGKYIAKKAIFDSEI